MTVPMPRQDQDPRPTRRVDARPLWSGGVATAVVAALTALDGICIPPLSNVPSWRREGAGALRLHRVAAAAAACSWPAALMYLP